MLLVLPNITNTAALNQSYPFFIITQTNQTLNPMRFQPFLLFIALVANLGYAQAQNNKATFQGKTITFKAADGVTITADLYMTANKNAPMIVLHHQAGYSRGAYRPIAPKLNKLGFNCLALDQRSGNAAQDIKNETKKAAVKMGKSTKYPDAIPDLEAGLAYAKNMLKAKKIIYWGSSYSASLMFYMASKYANDIQAVLAFSPGEYFQIGGKKIASFASRVKCPIFVTSAKNEQKQWQGIYDAIPAGKKQSFLPQSRGFHGSKALWYFNEGNQEYWLAVKAFLKSIN